MSGGPPPRRGRPADPEIEPKLRSAAMAELAEHGWRGATIDSLAARSGVSRTTIYRRHGSLHGVLLLTLDGLHEQIPIPDTGDLRTDLTQMFGRVLEVWRDPDNVRLLGALVSAQLEGGPFGQAYSDLTRERRRNVITIFERAAARGQLRPGVDPALFYDLALGAFMQRMLLLGEPIDEAFVDSVRSAILDGIAA